MNKKINLFSINNGIVDVMTCNVDSIEPLIISSANKSVSFDNKAVYLYSTIEDDVKIFYLLRIKNIDDSRVIFEYLNKITDHLFSNHFTKYNKPFSSIYFEHSQYLKYKDLSDRNNSSEISSVSNRLKEVFSRNDEDNREIVSILMDMNSKLDEILHLLKPKNIYDNSIDNTCLLLGEDGLLYCSDEENDKEFEYIDIILRDNSSFFTFTAICNSFLLFKHNNKYYYFAKFLELKNVIKDKLAKFIFSFERDILKEMDK